MKRGIQNYKIFSIIVIIVIIGVVYVLTRPVDQPASGILQLKPTLGSLTVLYDNYQFDSNCIPEWGYSCLIETTESVVLFDTGGDSDILANNIETLGVDIQSIDCIVLSHEHWDHVGGLDVILSQKPGLTVYVPRDFPYHVKSSIRSMGGECVELGNASKLSDSIAVTDTLIGPPVEQGLIVKIHEGVILVTGCSHPGVQNLARNTYELTDDVIQLVIGGYHLGGASSYMLGEICDELDEIGVVSVSPSHCTGDDSKVYFRERYSEHFIESGVGFHIDLESL